MNEDELSRLGDDSAALALVRLARQVQPQLAQVAEEVGVSWKDFLVLDELLRSGPHSQRELAELLGIDKTQMVIVIDELENRGLVRREKDSRDRRAYRLIVTRDGRSCARSVRRLMSRVDQSLVRTATVDFAWFSKTVTELATRLRRERSE